MHHAISQNLCKASSQNPSLFTSCASLIPYICLFPALFYHHTQSNDLQQNQHIALMVCWDEVSQVLYLLCSPFAKAKHMDQAITAVHIMPSAAGAHGWTGALCHPCQMCVTGLSGPINPYSSISLAEFTYLRL